jgi:hypothetical protein
MDTLAARAMRRATARTSSSATPGRGAEGGHVDGAEVCRHVVEAVGVRGDPGVVGEVFLHDHGDEGREAPRVGPGLDLEVMVGQRGGLGAARVDHDEAAGGVGGELLQDHPGPRKPVAVPWVLADKDGHLGVLEVARGVAPGSSRRAARPPRTPRSSPAPARWRCRPIRGPRGWPPRIPRRGGWPGRRRRNRRWMRRRGRRGWPRGARQPQRWRCPSRWARGCHRGDAAAGCRGGGRRAGSGRGAGPSRRCTPGRRGACGRRGS